MKQRLLCLALCVLFLLLPSCGGTEETDTWPSITPLQPTVPTFTAPTESGPPPTEPEHVPSGVNLLTGLPIDEGFDNKRPVAVMYNNLREALPMKGISKADIIFEALAEGGITRMVGVFMDPFEIPNIGSVRSTRSYYLDIALSMDAVLVHAGGSPQAYNEIPKRGVTNIDFTRGWNTYQWRDRERLKRGVSSEHCLFTSGKGIREIIEINPERFRCELLDDHRSPFRFAESFTASGSAAGKITLRYSNYKTGVFEYDAASGLYLVSQYGKPFEDGEDGTRVSAANVFVLIAEVAMIKGDPDGRLSTKLTGTGSGWYASGGKAVKITWSRKDGGAPFVLSREGEDELEIAKGKSYINVFPDYGTVNFE